MRSSLAHLFFDLIQVSIGTKERLSKVPTDMEWNALYDLAEKHSMAGVLFDGLEKTVNTFHCKVPSIFYEWLGAQQSTQCLNAFYNQRSKELIELFAQSGFKSCVLKGQGTALYYTHPENRQCGDIDVWVKGDRDEIITFIKSKGYTIR